MDTAAWITGPAAMPAVNIFAREACGLTSTPCSDGELTGEDLEFP